MLLVNPVSMSISLKRILKIERAAYPPHLREMQDAESWEDVADYAEVPIEQLVVLSDGISWYAIIAKHRFGRAEFVDLAKVPGAPIVDWFFILRTLRDMGIKKIFGDMREDTSYRRFKQQISSFERLGVKMTKDSPYTMYGETFHDFVVKI